MKRPGHISWLEVGKQTISLDECARCLRPAHSRGHQFVARYIEGFSHFVTSMTAPVASGGSESPGGSHTHWKAPPFTAHTHSGQSLAIRRTAALHPSTNPLRGRTLGYGRCARVRGNSLSGIWSGFEHGGS